MTETDSYLKRIGGGWPELEVEICDWCGRPTRDEDRRYVDRYVTWWICVDCYRTTRHTGYRPLYTTAQNSKPIPTEGNTGSQSEGV